MKNVVLILSSASILFLASCTEQDVALVSGSKTLNDTTYVTTPEAPQAHNVLLEEFTGCKCPNCPPAHDVIVSLQQTYGSQLIPISIHPAGNPQAVPVYPTSPYDFETTDGASIGLNIYGGIIGLPEAGVDRVPFSTQLQMTKDKWPSAVPARLGASTINLYVTSHYNAAAGTDTIAAMVSYTQAMTTPQYLNLAIVEDSLYNYQEDNLTVDTNYLYNGVFRDLATSVPAGDAILPAAASKPAGTVVKLYYIYKVSTSVLYNPAHCRVVAFLTDGTGGLNVLQTVQTTFTGQ